MEKCNSPHIRFKGFTEPWEQRKVEDLFKITRGYVLAATKTTENPESKNVYPVYSSQTANNGLLGYFDKFLYENAITWTTDGANAGTVNFRYGKFYCTNVCGVLISDKQKANTMFSYALGKVTKRNVSYVGNPKLMNNVMAKIEFKYPCNSLEQEKISKLFESIDSLITLHQRKCDRFKKVKQGLLEKMFPTEKKGTPKIRFKGFTEPWEQRKLWELTIWDKKFNEVESSKQPKTIKYPYVLADSLNNLEEPNGDVLLLSTGAYIGYTTKEKAGPNLCNGEIVAIPWGGVANIKYCSGFFVTADNRIATSSNKNKLDNKFLYWWMESNLISIQNTYRGASIKHPSMNAVLSLKISFPTQKEQKIISNFLDQVDTLITLHQRKCKKLKNIKSALLERMFV